MKSLMEGSIENIADIIANRSLKVHFQPIVSVSRKKVIGLEGLIRGAVKGSKSLISPSDLFEAACDAGLTLELDRLCRDMVIEAFIRIYGQDSDKLLFLNVDASILEKSSGSNYLLNQVREHTANPGNIVIEINETKVKDVTALKKFAEAYRDFGFMIALDDVGTGFSNMDRILLIKPDIIKVDMSLVRGIDIDYYKQGVFKSMVNLSNRIGALVVAEGVEKEEEATQILRLGGHMIQGFFFSKPQEFFDEAVIFSNNKIDHLRKSFNMSMNRRIGDERQKNNQISQIVNDSVRQLSGAVSDDFDNQLMKIVWAEKTLECIYILDEDGIQISDTICVNNKNQPGKSMFFYSARKGTDLSMEKYYYPLVSARLKKYITEPYISLATGNLCITYSRIFTNIEKKKCILCADFSLDDNLFSLELDNDKADGASLPEVNIKAATDINRIMSIMNEKIYTDSLTNTYNRRYIDEKLPVDITEANANNKPISLIMADLDHFKRVNETFGHSAGDKVLKEFSNIVKKNIRISSDWIARFGGEEFLIILINADEHAAFKVAEKIRLAVEKASVKFNGKSISVTASFGTFTVRPGTMSAEKMIEQADMKLYRAKKNGRNRTETSGSGIMCGM
ncbi:MAG: EAL domain-containing protein [Clostridiales bacterium]|nr:EAL domain-containing protein [Clostridiales bacterium]